MFDFTMEDIYTALEIMGKGMLGIFLTLAIIYGFVVLLTKLFPPKEGENNKND